MVTSPVEAAKPLYSAVVRRGRRTRKTAASLYRARMHRPTLGAAPHFHPESLAFFEEAVATSRVYLEYGCGPSTLMAARHAGTVVAVDSDRRFVKLVQDALNADGLAAHVDARILHSDIGLTMEWGRPVFQRLTPRRLARWRGYVEAPWDVLAAKGLVPDMVLIDGRFRIACVLETLRNLPPGSDCRVVVDDFGARNNSQYGDMQDFAELVEVRGTMGVFRWKPNEPAALECALDVYCQDWH